MKETALLLAVLLALGSLSLFGCSGGGTQEEGKTVTMVIESDKMTYYNGLKAEFEQLYAEEGYTISFVPVGGGQVEDKQSNMIAQRQAPDIIVGGDVHINSQYKYLLDLTELVERDAEEVDYDDFIPQIMNELPIDGKLYYLPEFLHTSLLYYNIDMFDRYNADPANTEKLEYPQADWTYEEFYAAADKLTDRPGYSEFGCYSIIGWWGEWLIHVRQAGGDFMKDGQVVLNTSEAKEGLQRYVDKMYAENRISNRVGELDLGGFSGGKYAMNYGGHVKDWVDFRAVEDLNWDIQLLPAVDGNQKGGELSISGLGIYAQSPNTEAAWAFIKFLTRKRDLEEWQAYPYIPPRTSGKNLLLSVPKEERPCPQNLEVAYQSLEEGYSTILPNERYFVYVNTQIVQNYVTRILEGEFSVADGLAEATQRANDYIRQNYS